MRSPASQAQIALLALSAALPAVARAQDPFRCEPTNFGQRCSGGGLDVMGPLPSLPSAPPQGTSTFTSGSAGSTPWLSPLPPTSNGMPLVPPSSTPFAVPPAGTTLPAGPRQDVGPTFLYLRDTPLPTAAQPNLPTATSGTALELNRYALTPLRLTETPLKPADAARLRVERNDLTAATSADRARYGGLKAVGELAHSLQVDAIKQARIDETVATVKPWDQIAKDGSEGYLFRVQMYRDYAGLPYVGGVAALGKGASPEAAYDTAIRTPHISRTVALPLDKDASTFLWATFRDGKPVISPLPFGRGLDARSTLSPSRPER